MVPGLVEPEARSDERERLGRRGLSGEAECRISRRQEVEDGEREQQDDEDDENRPQDPPDDVEGHIADGKARRRGPEGPASLASVNRLDHFFTAACANPASPAFWSNAHAVVFGPRTLTWFAHMYGTQGTTCVVSTRSMPA